MKKRKKDKFSIQADYYSKIRYSCVKCGRKRVIIHSRKCEICDWCGHLVFRTEKEYYDYYKRQNFKINLRRAMAKIEYNEKVSNS